MQVRIRKFFRAGEIGLWKRGGLINISSIVAGEDTLLPTSCTPVSKTEHASIFLNMLKYSSSAGIVLNKLFWLCQSSEYPCTCYIFGRLLKMPQVLNMARLYIQWLRRVPNMSDYISISLNNA